MARLSSDWTVELERLQAFGRLTRANGGVGRMFVDAPVWMRRGATLTGTDLEWLEDDGSGSGQTHELALLQRVYA
jgi:hypothetical protein